MLMSFLDAVITLIAAGLMFFSIEIFTMLCRDDACQGVDHRVDISVFSLAALAVFK